jgi:hypothetical protein
MAKQVPFVAHIRVIPARGYGKRFEYVREMQKLAVMVHDALQGVSGVTLCHPGGGQAASMGDVEQRPALGDFASGTGIKPQFGETPAQLVVAGFYESSNSNASPWASQQIFAHGNVYTGYRSHSNDSMPTSAVNTEVKTLKEALESAVATAIPDTTFSIFRMDYQGVTFGDRGFHFPR